MDSSQVYNIVDRVCIILATGLVAGSIAWGVHRSQRKTRRHDQLRDAHLSFLSALDLVTHLVSGMVKYLDGSYEGPEEKTDRALNEIETASRGVRLSLSRLKIIESNKNLLEMISKMMSEFGGWTYLTRAKADDFASHISDQRGAFIKALHKAYPLS